MVRKSVIWLCVGFFVLFAIALDSAGYAESIKGDLDGRAPQSAANVALPPNTLQQLCLSATITAINLEMERYQRWIDFRKQQGDQNSLTALQNSYTALQADLAKYLAMDAKDYVLPEKVNTIAWVGDRPETNAILYVEGMSKSGPWFHLAGIVGNNYAALQPNSKYPMSVYSVYPRSYGGMQSAYVCIAQMAESGAGLANRQSDLDGSDRQQASGKRITGKVFLSKYSGSVNQLVQCDNFQIYLLPDLKPGSKAELLLESKQSSFELTILNDKLEKYAYLEFVSPYGDKIIALNEIKDIPLQIILERNIFLKKPAIYLYPKAKSQIVITHQFKGKLLNTYPAYTDNWTVIAEPDGRLLNLRDSRYYNYLFWDGAYAFSKEHYQFASGFYVRNENYISFLQSKLAFIGLNENEINDFIVFWLPVMSNYQNCFIHFRINDNIDGSSVLETKPAAETIIRVFMEFTGIDSIPSAHKLPEQTLPTFVRKGFTLVEWGGAEIGDRKIE